MKKEFFRQLKVSEIKCKEKSEIGDLAEVAELNWNQYTIIPYFIPEIYKNSRKFMKHASEVKLKRVYSIEELTKYRKIKTPVQMRAEAFDKIKGHFFSGYSFMPVAGKDKRKRKVSLVECLEGARIFAYSHQKKIPIKIKIYDKAERVKSEGADAVVEVPSRTEKEKRIQFKMVCIPLMDYPYKYAVSFSINSDHSCPSKRFGEIRYRYFHEKESSRIINLCAHEIAAYFKLIEKELNEKKNIVPLQMSQFAIPTQKTVDCYLKWENNTLIYDKNLKTKSKIRKPNSAEKEIGLWALVEKFGHDATFYSQEKISNYNWTF